jgi:membrane associated rhomboid family serine protease
MDIRELHLRLRGLELPWVTLGLAVACLLACLIVEIGYGARLERADDGIRSAVDHFVRNPMLEIQPRLLPVLRDAMPGYEGNEVFRFLADGDEAEAQAELDARVQAGFATLDSHPQRRLGMVPAAPSWWAPLTHPLVHAGWLHLLTSLLVLLLVGPLLEGLWGSAVLAGALAGLAVASAGLFALLHPEVDRPLLGASALQSGLVAAALARFREREVDLLAWLAPVVRGELRGPAWSLGLVWGVAQLLAFRALSGSLPRAVDADPGFTAHIAAAALGVLLALGLERSGLEARLGHPPADLPEPPRHRALDLARVRRARESGDLDSAFELLREQISFAARNRDAVLVFWELALECERAEEAFPAMRRLVAEELRRSALEAAVSHWGRLADHTPAAALDPRTLVQLFPHIRELRGVEAARLALVQALEGEALDGPLCFEVAQLAAPIDPALAREAARRAIGCDDLGEAQRAELAPLLEEEALEDELPPLPAASAELPPNAFYEEQDRSAFGQIQDLGELTAASALDEPHPASPRLFPGVRVTAAVPVAVEPEALVIDVPGRGRARLACDRVRGIAVAGVRGLGPKAVVLLDLLLSGPEPGKTPLELARLRSDRFDPRQLVPGAPGPLDALLALAEELGRRAGCAIRPAPQLAGAGGPRLRTYESLELYTREVLRALPEAPTSETGDGSS